LPGCWLTRRLRSFAHLRGCAQDDNIFEKAEWRFSTVLRGVEIEERSLRSVARRAKLRRARESRANSGRDDRCLILVGNRGNSAPDHIVKAASSRPAAPFGTSRTPKLFEVEEDVDGAFSGIGAEPMADVVVVHREVAEDLRGFVLQAREIGFEFGFVEEPIGLNGKRFEDFAFGGDREAGKDEAGHFKLRAFGDARLVRDGVGGLVERFSGLDFRFEIAAAAVLFFDVIPASKNLLAVGEFGGLHGEEVVEIVGG